MVDLVGRTLLSKYRIERLLGQGGMGSVWQGSHALTGRKLAIKVLDERFLSNLNVVQRFGREARAASAIRHEGIVEVLDLDQTEEGVPFLVMEFLEGELLSRRIDRRGKLGQDELVRIGALLLDALQAAHAAGVVHRDLKPDNIFLVPAGRRGEIVKILDFGISSKLDEAQAKLTVTGSVLGTPHYMSPEQALGEAELDLRVDIYGAAVVLYECCVGDVPFDAANYNKLLRVILDDAPVPPRRRGADISEPLEQVILKGMAKDRKDRFATAHEFLAAWKEAAAGRSVVRARAGTATGAAASGDESVVARWEASDLVMTEGPATGRRSVTPPARPSSDRPPPSGASDPRRSRGGAPNTSGVVPRPLGGRLDDFDGPASGASLEIDEAALASARPSASQHRLQSPYARRASDPPPPISSPGVVVAPRPSPLPAAMTTGRQSAIPAQPSSAGTLAAPPDEPVPEAPPPWWRAWLIRSVIALAVFGGLVFGLRWLVRGGDEELDAPPPTVAQPDAPPETRTGPEWVLIDIDGLPPNARVRLDGLPGATLPLRVRRGSHHRIDISAPGYVDSHLEVDGTTSRRVASGLVPLVGTTQQQ
ncbi:MAG: protein kinase [Sandaracinus sp.]